MGGVDLLRLAEEAGLHVANERGKLVVRGPGAAKPVAEELLRRKDEVLAALAERGQGGFAATLRALPAEQLFDLAHNAEVPDRTREVARAEILTRADLLVDEVDGRRDPPNVSVIVTFDEARRRFGNRNLEERSITVWLRRQAPQVAARWPEAPVTAAWLDWRQHVGPEDIVALDKAFEATRERRAEEPGASQRKPKVRRRKPRREETSS